MLKKIKSVIIYFQDAVQHIYIARRQFPARIVLLLPPVIVFRSNSQEVVKDIVQKGVFIAVVRVKCDPAHLRPAAQLRDGNMFKILSVQHFCHGFFQTALCLQDPLVFHYLTLLLFCINNLHFSIIVNCDFRFSLL